MRNKLALTLIGFLANFIIAGFACQFGMLVEPIAAFFQRTPTEVATIFSLLHGGSLLGTIIAFFIIDKLGVKRITIINYIVIFICAYLLHTTTVFYLAAFYITLIGVCGSISLCLMGTLFIKLWQEKVQATLLVTQDVIFNAAGILFPLITTFTLTHHYRWSYSYFVAGCLALVVLVLTIFSHFKPCDVLIRAKNQAQKKVITTWNWHIFVGGLALFLSMLSLYAFLTWTPLFFSQKFGINFIQAGSLITHYWTAAIIGSLLASFLATRLAISNLLSLSMILAAITTFFLYYTRHADYLIYLIYIYGLVCAAPYNIFIAYGVSFIKIPTSKNVSFILLSGAAGSMFSPLISAQLQHIFNLQVIMYGIPLLYFVVFILLLLSHWGKCQDRKIFAH